MENCMFCSAPASWAVQKEFPERVSAETLSCNSHLADLFRMLNRDGTIDFVVREKK